MANKFKKEFGCLGENTEKCKICSESIEKEIRKIDRKCRENVAVISYKKYYWQCKIYQKLIIKSRP